VRGSSSPFLRGSLRFLFLPPNCQLHLVLFSPVSDRVTAFRFTGRAANARSRRPLFPFAKAACYRRGACHDKPCVSLFCVNPDFQPFSAQLDTWAAPPISSETTRSFSSSPFYLPSAFAPPHEVPQVLSVQRRDRSVPYNPSGTSLASSSRADLPFFRFLLLF